MKGKYLVLASLVTGIWLWGDFSLAQNQRTLVDEQGYADTIVVNGKIVSMDDRTYTPASLLISSLVPRAMILFPLIAILV